MRQAVIDIGNSKGIRIPQAILKQVDFGAEIDMDVKEGKIVLRRTVDREHLFGFETLHEMDDESIQKMLKRVPSSDIAIALIDSHRATKEAIYRNLPESVREVVAAKVHRLEKGNARDLIIERSRNVISEAFVELVRE